MARCTKAEVGRTQTSKVKGFDQPQRRKRKGYKHSKAGGKTLNRKSDGFPFRKLNDFESRNGGRGG